MRIQSHFNSIEGRVSQSLGVTRPVPVAFKLLATCRINLEHWQLRIGSDSEPSLQVIIYLLVFKSLFIIQVY